LNPAEKSSAAMPIPALVSSTSSASLTLGAAASVLLAF